jgi:long-chain fatty acid transport protein
MKKSLLAVLAATSLLFAESYQVNTLSARQLGMAHTGAGITTLGSEAMHFNPGGLGFLDKTLDLSAGVTFIIPNVEFFGAGGKADNTTVGTPLYVYAASSITDWFSAGVSFTTPYGNSVDYGENTVISTLLQDISLAVYAVQPTVAVNLKGFGLFPLSIGGGPTINFGSFSQSKMLLPAGKLNAYNGLLAMAPMVGALSAYYPELPGQLEPHLANVSEVVKKYEETPVSATFEGDADVAVGFHLGAMYEILPSKLSLGVSYRSKVDMKVSKGKVKGAEEIAADINKLNGSLVGAKNVLTGVEIPNPNPAVGGTIDIGRDMVPGPDPQLVGLSMIGVDNFEATLPLPSNLNAGVSFRPMDKLLLAFDFQWVGWSAYDELVLEFEESKIKQVSIKKYDDTFAYRLGAQYTVIDQLDVRCGIYFDESPVDDKYLTPEAPSTSKIAGTIGLSFRPIPNLSIDAALLRSVSTKGRDATSGSDEAIAAGKTDGVNGRYEVVAWAPSIGLGFNF